MSTLFNVYCKTCEVVGPPIRRGHNKGYLLQDRSPRFFPVSDPEHAALDWGGFLIEHEYHELTLEHEYARAQVRKEQEEHRQREWEEATRPTHRLTDDGGIEPL